MRASALLILLFAVCAEASPFANFSEIANDLGTPQYFSSTVQPQKKVKIAILDNGFSGYQAELGKTLPKNVTFHSGPVAVPQPEETHGLVMAQIVSALLTDDFTSKRFPFELHLFSAFGYSNLKAATDAVAAGDFDVVLYAQVWEYGGNGDGNGFINRLVTNATKSNAIWINAAGNFGQGVYRAPVKTDTDNFVRLPGPHGSIPIRCHDNPFDFCRLRLTLTWNDFKDDVTQGTEKDLDLEIRNAFQDLVQKSELKQSLKFPSGQPGFSLYPRELIQIEVPVGLYFVRVKANSKNFSDKDVLTISAFGEFTEMKDRQMFETIFSPADNPNVVTVGAEDTENSSTSDRLGKPELHFRSLLKLDDDRMFKGSSNSAAIAAAAAAIMRAMHPDLSRDQFLKLVTHNPNLPDIGVRSGRGRLRLPAPELH